MDVKPIEEMSLKELRVESNRLFSAMNKRIRRVNESGIYSPAVEALKKKGYTKFSSRGASKEELQRIYSEALHFKQLKTSTLGGARKVSAKMGKAQKEYEEKHGKLPKNYYYDLYNSMRDRFPESVFTNLTSDRVFEMINDLMDDDVVFTGDRERDLKTLTGRVIYEENLDSDFLDADFEELPF